jgi:hypothetical protein
MRLPNEVKSRIESRRVGLEDASWYDLVQVVKSDVAPLTQHRGRDKSEPMTRP